MAVTSTPHHVALVHVEDTHPEGSSLRRARLDGSWPLRQKHPMSIASYLDSIEVLLPVAYRIISGHRRLEVIDARQVVGWSINTDGRVDFATTAAPSLACLVGTASPVAWTPGDAWPVKVRDFDLNFLISTPDDLAA